MTRKDWIILMILIVSNGGLLYSFQLFMKRKIDKMRIVEERMEEIVNEFLDLLHNLLETVSEVEKNLGLEKS